MRLAVQSFVAVIGIAGTAFGVSTIELQGRPQSVVSAVTTLDVVLTGARERARTSSLGGVTVVLSPGTRTLEATVYDGRPDPSVPMSAQPVAGPFPFAVGVSASAPGIAGSTPFSVVIASDAEAVIASWQPGDPPLTSEPACDASGTQRIVFTNGGTSQSATLVCQTSLLQ